MKQKLFLMKTHSYALDHSYGPKQNMNSSQVTRSIQPSPRSIASQKSQNSVIELPTRFQSQDLSVILESEQDPQMKRYKYQCKNPQLVRLEKIQELVYNKKLQNKCKYTEKNRNIKKAVSVPKGSVSIMLNNQTQKHSNFNLTKKVTARSKFKMKWKTIQWLLKNRKEAITQLFSNYQVMVKYAKKKQNGLNKAEFTDLLSVVGLGTDLSEKLFYVFDEDQSGTIDYKELIVGLEVFKEDSIEEKMKVFFEICDTDGSGAISEQELYNVLKLNIASFSDRQKLKKTISKIFIECDINGDGQLDKQEILEAAKNNFTLRQLLQQGIRDVKQIDNLIDNDLHENFNEWVPASANFVNYKEGIFYPYNDKLLQAFKEMEEIYDKKETIFKYVHRDEQSNLFNQDA
ncbi:unnamed protein product [Paramecium octaurelia]|uniref:EF-hand domain-containing protein n=1 Tax=Paramecium octaurelia TaxID=43137 RepID=A0A8S1X507_PAROT|nr:unnamed protein product [Paramecium octaurelia]